MIHALHIPVPTNAYSGLPSLVREQTLKYKYPVEHHVCSIISGDDENANTACSIHSVVSHCKTTGPVMTDQDSV